MFDNKLASYGILDLIVNNIFESKLSKADLIGDIAFLLENLVFNQAVNIILALFKMPSQKHYDLVSNILSHNLSEASDNLCYEKKNIMRSWTNKFFFYGLF